VKNCIQAKYHCTDDGLTEGVNPHNRNEDVLLPCLWCQPEAHWIERRKLNPNKSEPLPLEILENVVQGKFRK
jgi:hypothetical protein